MKLSSHCPFLPCLAILAMGPSSETVHGLSLSMPPLHTPTSIRSQNALTTTTIRNISTSVDTSTRTTTTTTTSSASNTKYNSRMDPRLLARKIRQSQSLEQAFALLDAHYGYNDDDSSDTEPLELLPERVAAECLNMCAQYKNADAALKVLQRVSPASEMCRTRAIAVLGTCGRSHEACALLSRQPPLSSVGPYNSAIAALGRDKDWEAVLCILADMPDHFVSTTTLNATLTALRKSKRGLEALEVLRQATSPTSTWKQAAPDRVSYHLTLSALIDQGQVREACRLVKRMQEDSLQYPETGIPPNHETYNHLAAAMTGWPGRRAIVAEFFPDQMGKEICAGMDFEKWKLRRVGRGKSAYWELGHYRVSSALSLPSSSSNQHVQNKNDNTEEQYSLLVALQPNRNPAVNGMKLLFYRITEASTNQTEKLGYLLMINSQQTKSSQFLGQFVDTNIRGQGLAKIWLAIWFRLCLDAGLQPCTGKIRKPLLCLVLQHTFGMIPQVGGIPAEVSPGESEGQVILYSSDHVLEGVISPLDTRHQNIRISSTPAEPRGRPIEFGTNFEAPDVTILEASVSKVLQDRFSLTKLAQQEDLSSILLGG